MRLFVAIELPEAWRDAARSVRREIEDRLDAASRARLRWVEPSLLHLTLCFIGEVDQQHADVIGEALDAMAATEPVDVGLALTAAGTLGPPGRTQVVWLGVGGDAERLERLAALVERAVVNSGVSADERDFRPHVARAPSRVTHGAPGDRGGGCIRCCSGRGGVSRDRCRPGALRPR